MKKKTSLRTPKPSRFKEQGLGTPLNMLGGEVPKLDRSNLFEEIGTTGLWRFGGLVQEEFLTELRQLRTRMQKFREMHDNHPVVHATILGVEMSLRQVSFHVQTSSSKDEEVGDFLESCLDDMAFTFPDSLSQIITMLVYGFSLFELVYKYRRVDQSKYDDGRIGWSKWLPLAQDSLQPGGEWIFDRNGAVIGVHQLAPPDWQLRTLPMQKCMHFRTTVAKNNPEGQSLLRAMYIPWYFSKNLSEVEGIAAERLGTGLPVIYLGSDTKKSGANSDVELAKQIVRDVRADDQSGVVLPFAKMGEGAKEGQGILLELMSPPARGFIDFSEVIDRYDKRIAMAGLAQFLLLGMSATGSYALSKDHHDFFVMAISAWADMICAEINRSGIDRLVKLNNLKVDEMPQLVHSDIAVPDLVGLADYINTLAQNNLLIPDNTLEKHLRELAHLPEKDADAPTIVATNKETVVREQVPTNEEEVLPEKASVDARNAIGGAKYETKTNEYQRMLEGFYQDWSEQTALKLEKEKDSTKREALLFAAMILLADGLKQLGRSNLLEAFQIGAGEQAISPEGYARFTDLIAKNEAYIDSSLIPAIQVKALDGLKDTLLVAGGVVALEGLFSTMLGRVASYAGSYWASIHEGIGEQISQGENPNLVRMMRKLDPKADHCATCPPKAKIYANWDAMVAEAGIPGDGSDECFSNCRCVVLSETKPMSNTFVRI